MKESEKIIQECNEIAHELNKCMREAGWKGRYLNFCSKLSNRYSNCRIKLFEQQRLEHVRETLQKRAQIA